MPLVSDGFSARWAIRRRAAMLLLTIAAVPLTATFAAGQSESRQASHADPLAAVFLTPPKSARPDIRWWWPGDAVDDAGLQREIALLDEAGFGGAEIQAFNPGIPDIRPGERTAVTAGYAEPPFFGHVRVAAREAAKRGLRLDYTMGSAWPSGGGKAITPERALMELTMAVTAVSGGAKSPLKVEVPARTKRLGAFNSFDAWTRTPEGQNWRDRFEARGRVISVMAVRGHGPRLAPKPKSPIELSRWSNVERPGSIDAATRIDLTGRLGADGTLDWSPPPGDWQVFVFKQYASNSGVLGASGGGPQLVLDHFDRKGFEAHVARVGDPLFSGDTAGAPGLHATFVDSLELFQDLPWTEEFLTEFKRRRGYDLGPYLPFVVQPGWMEAWGNRYSLPYFEAAGDDSLGARVRADYHQTISDLVRDNFLRPWIAWNHAHGLKAKFQAHGGPIDILQGYGLADIPETEDLHGGADPHFMRLARSAADIYGRPLVSAEALVWKDRPFSVTPDEMRKRVDLLFASGVNAQTIHGHSYPFHAEKWPGWYAFQPTSFGKGFSSMLQEGNPIWPGVPTLTSYIARTNAVLREGRNVVPVALFLEPIGYFEGMDGDRASEVQRFDRLLAGGYDYDRLNPDGLAGSKMDARTLVTSGGHRFHALVLPAVVSLRAETAERIATYAEQGLPVFATGALPARDSGLKDFRERDIRVQMAMARVMKSGGRLLAEAELVAALADANIPPNLRFVGDAAHLVFIERAIGDRRVFFIHNAGGKARDASFITAATGGAERWDALTGERTPLPSRRVEDSLLITLPLAAGASALVVVGPRMSPGRMVAARELDAFELPTSAWKLSVEGRSAGGTPIVREFGNVAPGDWRAIAGLEHFVGRGSYSTEFRLPRGWRGGGRSVQLELAGVHDMATVTVNGQRLAPLISAPWSTELMPFLKTGSNLLEIEIANVPQNALIDVRRAGFKNLDPVPAGFEGPATLRLFSKGVRGAAP